MPFSRAVAFVAWSLAFGTSATLAAERWDLANEYGPATIHAQTADEFIRAVSELTGGEIEITAHHGSALGYKSLDQFDAVGDGALQLASSAFVFWTGIDPVFQLPSLPFVAPTIDDSRALYEAALPYYQEALGKANQVLLFATPWRASGLWGNRSFDSPQSLQGVKVRTYDVASTETMRQAGALPIQLSWADTIPQLTTNSVDSVLTSADGGVSAQLWELQSHFTDINYALPLQAIHINKDVFDALTDEQRTAVLEAAKRAEAFGWSLLDRRVAENYATMREHGVSILEEVPASFAASLREAGQPFVQNWKKTFGPEADAIFEKFEAARR